MARLDAALAAGDPDWQVTIAWQCYQQLRSIYHAPKTVGAGIGAVFFHERFGRPRLIATILVATGVLLNVT